VQKVPPREGGTDKSPSQEKWPNLLQEPGMIELKNLQQSGDYENPEWDSISWFLSRKKQEHNKNPKYLIKNPRTIIIEPPTWEPGIELKQESKWSDSQDG